nr:MAG TPA: hypothetical protein [Caudoviricetes sp.]
MERLTRRSSNGTGVYATPSGEPVEWENNRHNVLQKLAEYEDLEEQGRLIKFPCKIGDVVYRINRGAMKPVIPLRVVEYRFKIVGNCIREKICCSDDFLCKQPSIIYYAEDIGNKVFLTKSEAEAKLKELRGNNG